MIPRRLAVSLTVLWLAGCGDDGAGVTEDADPETDAAETSAPDETTTPTETTTPAETTTEPVDTAETVDEVDDVTESDADGGPTDSSDVVDDDVEDSTEELDPLLIPCEHPEYWPYSMLSDEIPMRVHYRVRDSVTMARTILSSLEYAWQVEIDELGFTRPLSDDGSCGPDAALDVFVWPDNEDVYVDFWADHPNTPWADGSTYMVVDPWRRGHYGGDQLDGTLAHELNHMCQAAYDWSDAEFIYEATATFIEDIVYDDDNSYLEILYDFQGHPDWSLDRNDDRETWYMYGGMLWLVYLQQRFFDGDPSFVADLWRGLRSPWEENEPDYVDSVEVLLEPHGVSFADTVVELARWRWYVGRRDDARHFEEAGAFPRDALPAVAATLDAAGDSAVVKPMMLGTSYVDVVGADGGPREVALSLETDVPADEVWFVVQALPGLEPDSDGETLTLPATVELTEVGAVVGRTLVVTALPGIAGDIDPDLRTDERFEATIHVGAP